LEAPVSFAAAALGGKIKAPVISGGEIEITVGKGTQYGEIITVQGAGMPRVGKRGSGDLKVIILAQVPKNLTAKQRELLEAFEKENSGGEGFFEKLFK